MDVDTQQRDAALDFDKKWEAREIPGWEDSSDSKPQANGNDNTGIWCASCKKLFYLLYTRPYVTYLQVKNIILNKLYTMLISPPKSTQRPLPSKLHLANRLLTPMAQQQSTPLTRLLSLQQKFVFGILPFTLIWPQIFSFHCPQY